MPGLTSKFALTLLLVLAPFLLVAQEIIDFSYKLIDDKIEITYSLTGQSSDRYEVNIYSSLDGFTKPLSLVTGDVGKDIIPSKDKTIVWDAKTELGEFEGDLSLKLRANFIPFLTFQIENDARFKRAKEHIISWSLAGEPESIKLELYQAGIKIGDIGTIATGAKYNWAIPKDLKTGENYRIKASGSERFAMSDAFSIKRKIPLILWAVPVAVIGGIVAIISGSSGGGGDNGIPDPVGPN